MFLRSWQKNKNELKSMIKENRDFFKTIKLEVNRIIYNFSNKTDVNAVILKDFSRLQVFRYF